MISYSHPDFFLLTFKDSLVSTLIPWSYLLSSCHSFKFIILYMYLKHPDNNFACNFILYHIQFEFHTFHPTQALFLRYHDLSQNISSSTIYLSAVFDTPDYLLPNLSFLWCFSSRGLLLLLLLLLWLLLLLLLWLFSACCKLYTCSE